MTIISLRIKGGIGNQLFQQIFSKHISRTLNANIHLDALSYLFDSGRSAIRPVYHNIYTNHLIAIVFRAVSRLCPKNLVFSNITFINDFTNETEISNAHNSRLVIINGYFQRYCTDKWLIQLSDIRSIHLLFQYKHRYSFPAKSLPVNSLAVHIRRGDYLNPITKMIVLDVDYYVRAIKLFMDSYAIEAILFFGEDSEWIRTNLLTLYPANSQHVYSVSPYLDMLAISKSRYHVISNSTFSWWSAVLSRTYHDQIFILSPSLWSIDPFVQSLAPGKLDYINGINYIEA